MVQLSEQERSDVERELSGLNQRLQDLQQQQQQGREHVEQLNRQRDQCTKQRNSAALLQAFNASMIEQQQMLASIQAGIVKLEREKYDVVRRMKAACRTEQAYQTVHHKEEHRLERQQTLHSQREMDDLVAGRAATRAATGTA
ncbi:MAG: hypothetical protein COW18_02135 [Zetaproteobacteria bacterium CG12_big_fil_rev_8_21_14_0_65_54_13]|nr:MAG: hypothetical protein COX55_08495 [Zetaproteobacteria bacterium CG23_combo_of_CG06-09_8_20_14_all_54_7]PIW51253.1 MAG: hypothetical protein COW18_02135 [Zetaproteobacteria bacterium CG12_big_fil_rev_8_21_14_0_65_54_13]PIX53551.1 MAG: hypothetical protein COZ50_12830 [Zetaproteobacteria bacterium CG_4_10_14_3_um_filter_54_28]PJA28362.1 MAG: hypothetical protein CO188_09875 [Zetaproteobacteria bacterium CG_4_9_14_3_um_filter_54_145]